MVTNTWLITIRGFDYVSVHIETKQKVSFKQMRIFPERSRKENVEQLMLQRPANAIFCKFIFFFNFFSIFPICFTYPCAERRNDKKFEKKMQQNENEYIFYMRKVITEICKIDRVCFRYYCHEAEIGGMLWVSFHLVISFTI